MIKRKHIIKLIKNQKIKYSATYKKTIGKLNETLEIKNKNIIIKTK